MTLARKLMALVAQRNAEPGGWDEDRTPATPPARVTATCELWPLQQPHAEHDWEAPCDGPARCPGYADDACPLCPDPENPAARGSDAPYASGGLVLPPVPQRHSREFIAAISAPRPITDLCNQGEHYECGRCGCGCHPPLTTWSRT